MEDIKKVCMDPELLYRPGMDRALVLVRELRAHCIEYNIPKQAEIGGVAWNVDSIKEQAYLAGKDFMRERVISVLGLSKR